MYHIIGYQTNPITGETQYQILCDTAADLPASPVSDNGYGGEIGQGSKAVVIADGSSYLADSNRQWIYQPNPNAWANVYTKSEIDEMITEIYETIAYYHTTLVSDTGEITFYAFAGYIGTWTIFGNGSQSGTPTPDAPIMPTFCGTLDGTDWKIPITCAGQTVPVYLGQVSTVRKIRKLVLTGEETWYMWNLQSETLQRFYTRLPTGMVSQGVLAAICSHFETVQDNTQESMRFSASSGQNYNQPVIVINRSRLATVDVAGFKSYLSAQYQNGTPVTIWYILAEPTTGIVNEPLCKIGDYADELSSEDTGVTIPTVKGANVLTVDTILKPSRIEIQG